MLGRFVLALHINCMHTPYQDINPEPAATGSWAEKIKRNARDRSEASTQRALGGM
jgi:hypothetical protein